MRLRHLPAATLIIGTLTFPVLALAAECDADLSSADTAIAAGPLHNVSPVDFQKARLLRSVAGQLLSTGDDAGCMNTIGEALELLGISFRDGD